MTHAMIDADGLGEEYAELLGDQPELHCDTTNSNRLVQLGRFGAPPHHVLREAHISPQTMSGDVQQRTR